jgi:hypothetical protein
MALPVVVGEAIAVAIEKANCEGIREGTSEGTCAAIGAATVGVELSARTALRVWSARESA